MDMKNAKRWFHSKTVWVNAGAILASILLALQSPDFQGHTIAILALFGIEAEPAAVAAIVVVLVAVVNIALRFVTKGPIK